jgi:hypothetical protein
MTGWKMIAVVAALTGCAGVQTTRERDVAAGHWVGEIDREDSWQPLSLDIEHENGVYRGELRSVAGARGRPLENVRVLGDEVRFETEKLRFVGRVSGSTLSGTVARKDEGAPIGEFSVNSDDAERGIYSSGSEWSP